jgi:hypothetical protein
MNRLAALAVPVALASLPGCATDGIDLAGTYQVTVHTVDTTGCANLVATTTPAYVRFEEGDLVGNTYYSLHGCTDLAQVECPSLGLYGVFGEPLDDGWRAELGLSQSPGGCILEYARAEATLVDGALVVVGHRYRDESDRPESECTGEHALDLGDSMPCVGAEHLEATQIQ